ncbi:MAG: RNA polymerase sigma factor [Solirubrobacterales bacterium]
MSRGNAEAFNGFYEEHVWHVYGFFGYRLGSREDAEDLTQITFERALKAWNRFDERRASGSTWLMAIARNLLVDHYRRGGSERAEPIDFAEAGEPADAIESHEEKTLGISPELEEALGRLDHRQLELVALRFGADLTGPEIAELTGLSLANVQQILSRSLRRLRAELDSKETAEKSQPAGKREPSPA